MSRNVLYTALQITEPTRSNNRNARCLPGIFCSKKLPSDVKASGKWGIEMLKKAGIVLGIVICLAGAILGEKSLQAMSRDGSALWNGSTIREEKVQEAARKVLTQAAQKLEAADSMETTLEITVQARIFKLDAQAQIQAEFVTFRDPLRLKTQIETDLGWLGSSSAQLIAADTEEGCQLFTAKEKKKGLFDFAGKITGNGTKETEWTRRSLPAGKLAAYSGRDLMKTYLDQLTDVVYEGEKKLDGRSVYQYTAVISHKGLKKILLDTGSLEVLLETGTANLWKPLRNIFMKNKDQIPEMMDRAEDMKVTVWVDKETGYPAGGSMDITHMLDGALRELTGQENTAGTGVQNALIRITCSRFDQAREFTIPE